jgi:hypothetical protein
MHCLWRCSLLVNAATKRTTARGMIRQAPTAAAMYAPHLTYSRYSTRGPSRSGDRLKALTPQLSLPYLGDQTETPNLYCSNGPGLIRTNLATRTTYIPPTELPANVITPGCSHSEGNTVESTTVLCCGAG